MQEDPSPQNSKSNLDALFEMTKNVVYKLDPKRKIIDEISDEFIKENYETAILLSIKGLSEFSEDKYIFYKRLSDIYAEQKNFEESLNFINCAIQALPSNFENYVNLLSFYYDSKVDILISMKDYIAALEAINNSLLPTSTLNNFGYQKKSKILIKLNRLEDAELLLNACILSISPKNTNDFLDLASFHEIRKSVYEIQGNIEAASKEKDIIDEYWGKSFDSF